MLFRSGSRLEVHQQALWNPQSRQLLIECMLEKPSLPGLILKVGREADPGTGSQWVPGMGSTCFQHRADTQCSAHEINPHLQFSKRSLLVQLVAAFVRTSVQLNNQAAIHCASPRILKHRASLGM